jgi:hypothetical protein
MKYFSKADFMYLQVCFTLKALAMATPNVAVAAQSKTNEGPKLDHLATNAAVLPP